MSESQNQSSDRIEQARPRQRSVTLAGLAKETGVTAQSVSRAFHSPQLVKPATLTRIKTMAREMGYRPNAAARALKHGKRTGVGLLFAAPNKKEQISSLFRAYSQLLEQLCIECSKEKLNLVLGLMNQVVSPEVDLSDLPDTVQNVHVGPLIAFTHMWDDLALALGAWHIPTIVVDGPACGLPAVQTDEALSMHTLVDHLVSLGHQRIAFFNAFRRLTMPGFRDVIWPQAYQDAMARHRLKPYEQMTCDLLDDHEQLASVFASADSPTAVIGYDDHVALNMTHALTTMGLRVPEDVSVAALYAIGASYYSSIKLTCMIRDDNAMVGHVMQWLTENVTAGPLPQPSVLRLPAHLVVGQTSAPPPNKPK